MSEDLKKCAQCEAELPEGSASSLCPKCLLQMGFETKPDDGSGQSKASDYQPTFIPPTVDELAPQFPSLEILEVIGHGGMGVVYKARQTELDRIVALKILRPGISEDPSFAERFQREARALAKLNHPNIITVFDFGRQDSLFYFIMEYVDGTNLRHLERVGELNPAEALGIVPQVCSALQYAHDNGVVHRDIKPENILLTKQGDVRIADFGLAKLAGTVDNAPLTGTWQVMGTPHYMAPEQFEKPTSVDHRADIFSLGVVIYELLTGELPLGRFPLPSQKAQVDVRLDEVVLKSLDKEPDRRYQHVTDVASAVEEASGPRPATAIDQAKAWVKGSAEVVGESAKSLRMRAPGVKPVFHRVVNWLGERKRGLGTAMMWFGVVDGALALLTMFEGSPRMTPDLVGIAFMSLVAAVVTFLFGRQLKRRQDASLALKIAALFCLLPWFGCFPPSALVRMLLVAAGLLAIRAKSESSDEPPDTRPDFVDRAGAFAKSVWQMLTVRVLMCTVLGIAGWIVVCVFTFGAINQFFYRYNVPAKSTINDRTAEGMSPVSAAYEELSILASETGESRGLDVDHDTFERTRLTLSLEAQPETAPFLFVDLDSGICHVGFDLASASEAMPISDGTVVRWMADSGVETDNEAVRQEAAHLSEVLLLMNLTRGSCDRLSVRDREEFPTLAAGITTILRDESLMARNVIPVGRLIDSTLFTAPNADHKPARNIRRHLWAENVYFFVLFLLAITGFLRICRVLYGQVYKPAFVQSESDQVATVARWRRCSLSLVAVGLIVAVSLTLVCWLMPDDSSGGVMPFLNEAFESVDSLADRIMIGLIFVSVLIAACGLAARPLFRASGWWIGSVGGALALFVLPLSLLTYPTGLAVWIALTDRNVRQVFGGKSAVKPAEVARVTTIVSE